MEVNADTLLMIIGKKEIEVFQLQSQLVKSTEALKQLAEENKQLKDKYEKEDNKK